VKRLASAAFIIPPLILFYLYGPPYALSLIVAGVSLLGMREFYRLTGARGEKGGIILGVLLCFTYQWLPWEARVGVLMILLFSVFIYQIIRGELEDALRQIALPLLCILYIPFLLSHFILIDKEPDGRYWVLLLIASVWIGDTFALVVGKLWGRHPLSPRISPNKTVEGFIACFGGVLVVVMIFHRLLLSPISPLAMILSALGIGLFSQIGDLSESLLKRQAGVKDSGSLIPGHGGMLDRLDSFLFSAPFLYYFLHFLVNGGGR